MFKKLLLSFFLVLVVLFFASKSQAVLAAPVNPTPTPPALTFSCVYNAALPIKCNPVGVNNCGSLLDTVSVTHCKKFESDPTKCNTQQSISCTNPIEKGGGKKGPNPWYNPSYDEFVKKVFDTNC